MVKKRNHHMRMDCWHRWLDFKYGEGNGPPPLFPLKRKINVGERAQIWKRSRFFPRNDIGPSILLDHTMSPVPSSLLDNTDTAGDPADSASESSSSSDSSLSSSSSSNSDML